MKRHDPFNDGLFREFFKVGAIALVLNLVFWAAIVAIVLFGLNIAGVI